METLSGFALYHFKWRASLEEHWNRTISGTKLVSLDSFFNNPGMYEVEMGTPLSEVVNELGGGFKSDVKAIQIGGPLGGLVPVSKIGDLTIDFESFSQEGFLLGHASVVSCLQIIQS